MNIYKVLDKADKISRQLRSGSDEVINTAYDNACAARDKPAAAAAAREKRDKLLLASDANMAVDRIGGLSIPANSENIVFDTVTAVAAFLSTATESEMAAYRQQLRDLPEQPGWPFDIIWPEKPTESVS